MRADRLPNNASITHSLADHRSRAVIMPGFKYHFITVLKALKIRIES
jgi:hypothetical protein